jgi:hypothetical protein
MPETVPTVPKKKKDDKECEFCTFMRGTPCKKQFVAWEACFEECDALTPKDTKAAKKCAAIKCDTLMAITQTCMEKHPDLFGERPK